MRVLVTGATGFLGGAIARALVAAGHDVSALVRRPDALAAQPGLGLVVGDLGDVATLHAAARGVDAIVHAAGRVSARPRDAAAVWRANVDGTANVVAAAARRDGLRLLYTSSIAACASSIEPEVLDETTPITDDAHGYAYLESKRAAQRVVDDAVRAGLVAVSLFPAVVLGPGDTHLGSTRLVLEYLRGRNRFSTRGGFAVCDVRDVAAAHVAALDRGRCGERYILGGHNVSNDELLGALHRLTGRWRPRRLPAAVVLAAATLSELVARLRPHGIEELNRAYVRRALRYAYFDIGKARRELGYEVRPLDETLRDTIADLEARRLIY